MAVQPKKGVEQMEDQALVYSFPKNESEEMRFTLREYKGRCYADIRLFYSSAEGVFHPTKKGVTVSVEHFGQLVNGIEKLSERLAVEGGVS